MNLCWTSLPLGEWRRRPARQACTVVGVALAVGSLFALLGFERGYRESLQNQLNRLGAQILIVPKGCPYDAASLALHGANWRCYLKADYLRSVRAVSGIAAAVPVLMSAVSGGEGRPVVYVGTEATLLGLRPRWRISGRFPERRDRTRASPSHQHSNGDGEKLCGEFHLSLRMRAGCSL